jgi:hypothetical protein
MGKSNKKTQFDATYNEVRQQLKRGVSSEAGGGKEATMWAVIEATAAIFDGVMSAALGGPIGGMVSGTIRLYYDMISDSTSEPSAVPNPWFVWNGHDDNPTWYTREYMKNRNLKGIAGGAVALAGMGVSFVSQVDVGGILQHGNAVGSTGAHMVKFQSIAKSYRESRTIANWLGVIMKMKAMKLGVRGAGLVGSCVPVPAVGAVTGVLAAAGKLGAKLSMTKVCLATSADLHWRAYQEMTLTRTFGGTGPALRIIRELFTRRGATRVFGKYDVDQIIREPNGWIAINDKLMLI